jgi:hypothetical protein
MGLSSDERGAKRVERKISIPVRFVKGAIREAPFPPAIFWRLPQPSFPCMTGTLGTRCRQRDAGKQYFFNCLFGPQ